MLFLLDINVDDRGLGLEELFDLWEKEADAALQAKEGGLIRHLFKVVGQRRVIAVIESDDADMVDDILMAKLPMAHNLSIDGVMPIREYASFAASLKKRFTD